MKGHPSAALRRCSWAEGDPLLRAYHDEEWGVPEHDGRRLWEKLMLDGFQAGLSWTTILRKREAFRRAFRGFRPERVARFRPADVRRCLNDPGIVRSRAKIEATIRGARSFLAMRAAGDDFSKFVWGFVDGKPIQNAGPVPARTARSEALSKELKKRGFSFVGPVIVYAWMQASGLVNDHAPECFRRLPVERLGRLGSAAPPRERRTTSRRRSAREAVGRPGQGRKSALPRAGSPRGFARKGAPAQILGKPHRNPLGSSSDEARPIDPSPPRCASSRLNRSQGWLTPCEAVCSFSRSRQTLSWFRGRSHIRRYGSIGSTSERLA